ncbi:MAG: hypothetical protein OXN17_08640 [Candidatus Poribacteria bacterium]|nr:hypothetical protein [Candidatus Poribacteria bacterium]MDE0506930.1 hypothetical protein [Candidatus Poribacteria bacterium]
MCFVRFRDVKERLRERSLRDNEVLPYLLLDCVVYALPGAAGEHGLILFLWRLIIAIGGVIYVYNSNGGAYGFDLVQKFLILGWVVFFRFLLVFLPVFIVSVLLGFSTATLGGMLLLITLDIIVYQRIGRHIRDTTQ